MLEGDNLKRREFYHHGIKGQEWGKRNGPPYPLTKHSVAKRKAALDKSERKRYNKSKTVERGKYFAGSILEKIGDKPISELGANLTGNIKMLAKPESVDEVLRSVNPSSGGTNCCGCVVASSLRLCGYDVTAALNIPKSGKQIYEVAKVFKINADNRHKIFDVGGPTVERLSRNIEKRYKNGDIGAIAFVWNEDLKSLQNTGSDSGHTLNWILQDGKVRFFDTQCAKDDTYMRQILTRGIDNHIFATVAQFTNVENGIDLATDVDMDALKRYIK